MKVLQLALNYYPSIGGHQQFMQRTAEGLVSQFGDEVTVFTSDALRSPGSREAGRIEQRHEVVGGVAVRRFRVARRAHDAVRLVQRGLHRVGRQIPVIAHPLLFGPLSPSMAAATFPAARRADVVCGAPLDFLTVYYAVGAARLGRRRPLVVFGALHLDATPPSRLAMAAIRSADVYIAHTGFERDALTSRGIAEDKIAVVPPGVELGPFTGATGQATRSRYGLGDDPVVLFLGRQAAYKGLPMLLDAMAEVWRLVPEAHLVIAGAPTPWSPQLRGLIDAFSAPHQQRVVVIDGFAEADKPDLVAAGNVVVSVSSAESFGIVYLEAWAASRPVIGSAHGAAGDVIRDGVDGLHVAPGDHGHLARAIVDILQDPALGRRMGLSGRAKVETSFRWPAVVEAWRQALVQAVERG